RRGFERPIPVENEEFYATISVGIATCQPANEEPRLLVPHAEQALDAARIRGLESVAFYAGEKPRERLFSLATQLHDALRGGEFDLWFQPLFEVSNSNDIHSQNGRRIVGAEALLRWNHPRRGLIEPESFLDMLDSMSLSERVGGWVLDNALMHVSNWRKRGHDVAVWINVFGRQLVDPEFFGSLRGRLLRHGLTPASVVVEVTERIIAREETEVVAIVNKLRSAGVRVAIDDFGTGHSTLARLQNIPFDIVKIDQSFIRGIEADSRSSGVVTTLIALARELDATIVAEGIETDGQLEFLVRHGCHTIQGYRLGLPMPASEFESFLRRTNIPSP
ncbi:MAG: putative bifunctional diguanylate cyclase/phosphodiesterase, partial [Vulcanimicrobiaceae bacterium]